MVDVDVLVEDVELDSFEPVEPLESPPDDELVELEPELEEPAPSVLVADAVREDEPRLSVL